MEFGLFSQSERAVRFSAEAWDQDIEEIVLAEKLGFAEAWVAEHPTGPRPGVQQRADLFICKVAGLTKRIRLGPGIRVLPLYHPVHVATEAAVCDHLMPGRYMAGFGAGAERGTTLENLGIGHTSDSHAMMYESIDFILRCWTATEPFDYDGRFWQCKNVKVHPKPLQQPHMPVGLACSRAGQSLQFAAQRGLLPLIGHFDRASFLREMIDIFLRANEAAGRPPRRRDIRIPRYVHISDSVKKAKEEVRDSYMRMFERRKREFPYQFEHLVPEGGTPNDITFDYMLDVGAIHVGTPDTVYESLKAGYDEMGGFGVMLIPVGKDVATREQRLRSLRLFMKHVAPRLAALDPDREVAVG